MRISTKLLLGFAIIVSISFAIGAIGINSMTNLRHSGEIMYENRVLAMQYVNSAARSFTYLRVTGHRLVMSSFHSDRQDAETSRADFELGVAEFSYWLEKSREIATTDELKYFHDMIFYLFETVYLPNMRELLDESINDIPYQAERYRINAMVIAVRDYALEIEDLITGLVELNAALAEAQNEENLAIIQQYIIFQVVLYVISVMLACAVAVLILRSILKPINESAAVLGRVAEGDFTARVVGHYTGEMALIKDSVNNTAAQLASHVEKITEAMAEMQRIEVAEQASKAKSKFLARMSHEIRTPITVVLGLSEIHLHDPGLPPNIEESFTKIHNSASFLVNIVNDILDLSKIEAGKMEIIEEEYEVANMISDVAQLHLAYLGDRPIEFKLRADKDLPAYLIGDALRVGQILNNILSNAFKYTEAGEVYLSLEAEKADSDDDRVILKIFVRDTGMGMTPAQLNDMYAEYSRFHERHSRYIGGSGLGMPIVYNLVQLMNAEIITESEENAGTSVLIRIPQRVSRQGILGEENAARLQKFEAVSATKFKVAPEPMPYGKVLVVDDLAANSFVAEGLLALYGLKVEICSSGKDAIEKIKQGKKYDIIFMDSMMPGLSGTETMLLLRTTGYTAPIVAFTANVLEGQAEEFMELGFDAFISKPIQTKELNAVLMKFIKEHPSPDTKDISDEYHKNPETQAKLREEFAASEKDAVKNLRAVLEKNDIKTAHRLAHSLKSVANLIDEAALFAAADRVDSMFIANTPEKISADMLDELQAELTSVLAGIKIPENSFDFGEKVFDKAKAAKIFARLAPLLKAHSSECLRCLDELAAIPETAVLVRQIKRFDFAAAAVTLATLEEVFGNG